MYVIVLHERFCRNFFLFVDCFSNPEKWEKFTRVVIAYSVGLGLIREMLLA